LDISASIIAMERAALERFGRGDPDGFLEICAADVSYFDPFTARRIDGVDALRECYEQVRGAVQFEEFDLIDPRVQVAGEAAVLTFRFRSASSAGAADWNTTEVYRKTPEGWRIVHTHWAFHQPKLAC
jgi:ketosteroid isomerase-like protein